MLHLIFEKLLLNYCGSFIEVFYYTTIFNKTSKHNVHSFIVIIHISFMKVSKRF